LSYLLQLWRASLQSVDTVERVGFAGLEEQFDYLRQQTGMTKDQGDRKGGIEM
jgi:hypothetical protein